MGKFTSFILEFIRLCILLILTLLIFGALERYTYQVIYSRPIYHWSMTLGNIILFLVLYRNYFQFKGWYKSENNRKLSKTLTASLIVISLVLIVMPTTSIHNSNGIVTNSLRSRMPTEKEVIRFQDSRGIKALAVKYYTDHAIILGDHSIFSLAIIGENNEQFMGSSWGLASDRIDVTAVLQTTPFVGIIIHQKDVIDQGGKLKIIFEDNATVEQLMNHEEAFIIDHPFGKLTNSAKAKLEIFNTKNEVIYQNY